MATMTLDQACNLAQNITAIEGDRWSHEPKWEVWQITKATVGPGYLVQVVLTHARNNQPPGLTTIITIHQWGEWRRILHAHFPDDFDIDGEYLHEYETDTDEQEGKE
jgi:hypothetical protein